MSFFGRHINQKRKIFIHISLMPQQTKSTLMQHNILLMYIYIYIYVYIYVYIYMYRTTCVCVLVCARRELHCVFVMCVILFMLPRCVKGELCRSGEEVLIWKRKNIHKQTQFGFSDDWINWINKLTLKDNTVYTVLLLCICGGPCQLSSFKRVAPVTQRSCIITNSSPLVVHTERSISALKTNCRIIQEAWWWWQRLCVFKLFPRCRPVNLNLLTVHNHMDAVILCCDWDSDPPNILESDKVTLFFFFLSYALNDIIT